MRKMIFVKFRSKNRKQAQANSKNKKNVSKRAFLAFVGSKSLSAYLSFPLNKCEDNEPENRNPEDKNRRTNDSSVAFFFRESFASDRKFHNI